MGVNIKVKFGMNLSTKANCTILWKLYKSNGAPISLAERLLASFSRYDDNCPDSCRFFLQQMHQIAGIAGL